jgi:hypothetical protein
MNQTFEQKDIQFRHPFTLTISGSTGSGKSEWIMKLLQQVDLLINKPVAQILYCYGELNANVLRLQRGGYSSVPVVYVHNGLPTEEDIRKRAQETGGQLLVVLDDLMVGMSQQFLDTLFTRGSHNWGVSVILVTQHLFTKELRIARNNSHYLVLMRNPAGELQVRTLASQLFPGHLPYFVESYHDACKRNFGYLLVDMHPESPPALRLRTHIYSEEHPLVVYVPK